MRLVDCLDWPSALFAVRNDSDVVIPLDGHTPQEAMDAYEHETGVRLHRTTAVVMRGELHVSKRRRRWD